MALGCGLRDAGYEVVLATNDNFADSVGALGLKFSCLPGNPEQVLASESGDDFLRNPSSPVELVSRFSKLFFPLLGRCLVDSLPACRSTNAIIASPLAYFGYDIAQALRVPFFPCSLVPMTPTGDFPFPMIQSPISLGSFGNQMSYTLARQVFWQFMRDNINPWRKEYLNLPALGIGDEPTAKMESSNVAFVYGYSSRVVPRPSDWSGRHQITGYWPLTAGVLWQPDEKLTAFVNTSNPLVVFRFGTMSEREQTRLVKITERALDSTSMRGVYLTDLIPADAVASDSVCYAPSIAAEWVMQRSVLVIHHCDSETSATAMRAGKPSIPMPIFADQFFWSGRMQSLGVASKAIAAKDYQSENLAALLKIALRDEDLSRQAEKLSQELSTENGVGNAVAYLRKRLS